MNLSAVTLDQLLTLRAIARAGSFSRAADELFVSQPAVSQRIAHLEGALGFKLFHRDRSPLALTDQGEAALTLADAVFDSFESFRDGLASPKSERPTLTIAVGNIFAVCALPRLLEIYKEHSPHVTIRVMEAAGDGINELVASGVADVGIHAHRSSDTSLVCMPLFSDPLVLVASVEYAQYLGGVSLEHRDRRSYSFVLPPPHHSLRRIADIWAHSVNITYSDLIETDGLAFLKEAVKAGMGMTLTAQMAVAEELKDGVLVRIEAPHIPPELTFCCLVKADNLIRPVVRALLDGLPELRASNISHGEVSVALSLF